MILTTCFLRSRSKVALENEEIFSDVLVAKRYPARSFATSVLLFIGMITLLFSLSGMKFGQTLPLTGASPSETSTFTYYKACADLLPKISSASDGPKDPPVRERMLSLPRGVRHFILLKRFNPRRQDLIILLRRSSSQALPMSRSNRR